MLAGRKEETNNCIPFTKLSKHGEKLKARDKIWGPFQLFDPSLRTFEARLGPAGREKGYTGTTGLPTIGE